MRIRAHDGQRSVGFFLDSSRYLVSNKLHILLLVKEGKAIKGSR